MTSAGTPDLRWWRQSALAVLRHPSLWVTALGAARRLAPPGWWRRRPHVPLPDPDYLRFRMETQYGAATPDPDDVVTYLRWLRSVNRSVNRSA